MRAETIVRNVYSFSELSESAKAHAINEYRSDGMAWGWEREWQQSLNAFEKRIGFPLVDHNGDSREPAEEIESAYPDWFQFGQDGSHMSGIRLWKWIVNGNWQFSPEEIRSNGQGGCSLTGFCGDCPFFDVFVRFLDRPWNATLAELLYESIQDWERERNADEEDSNSDETIGNWLSENGSEFDEYGNLI